MFPCHDKQLPHLRDREERGREREREGERERERERVRERERERERDLDEKKLGVTTPLCTRPHLLVTTLHPYLPNHTHIY